MRPAEARRGNGPSDGAAAGDLCSRCKHYRVSWDRLRPYGCRAMAFKSSRRPCVVVFESSGLPCQAFSARPRTD